MAAAFEIPGFVLGTQEAASDLSTKQYYAVTFNTSAKVALAAASQRTVGILQNVPAAGDPAQVMLSGVSKAVAGGTVTKGDDITTKSDGTLIKATDDTEVCGMALTSAGSGERFALLLGYHGRFEVLSPA